MPTSPISVIITPNYDTPQYNETSYDTLLRTQAHRHGAMLHETDYVTTEPFPTLTGEGLRSPYLDHQSKACKIKEEYPSDLPKLRSGALIHLCDEDLWSTPMDLSYIQLVGGEEKMSWREFGFHICEFKLHLYTSPLIAPSPSLCEDVHCGTRLPSSWGGEMEETNFCTLEQRFSRENMWWEPAAPLGEEERLEASSKKRISGVPERWEEWIRGGVSSEYITRWPSNDHNNPNLSIIQPVPTERCNLIFGS